MNRLKTTMAFSAPEIMFGINMAVICGGGIYAVTPFFLVGFIPSLAFTVWTHVRTNRKFGNFAKSL